MTWWSVISISFAPHTTDFAIPCTLQRGTNYPVDTVIRNTSFLTIRNWRASFRISLNMELTICYVCHHKKKPVHPVARNPLLLTSLNDNAWLPAYSVNAEFHMFELRDKTKPRPARSALRNPDFVHSVIKVSSSRELWKKKIVIPRKCRLRGEHAREEGLQFNGKSKAKSCSRNAWETKPFLPHKISKENDFQLNVEGCRLLAKDSGSDLDFHNADGRRTVPTAYATAKTISSLRHIKRLKMGSSRDSDLLFSKTMQKKVR